MAENLVAAVGQAVRALGNSEELARRAAAVIKETREWEVEQRAQYSPDAADGTRMTWLVNLPIRKAKILDDVEQEAKEEWAKECGKSYNDDWEKMEHAIVTGGIVMQGKVKSAEEWKVEEGYYSVAVYGSLPQKV